LGESAAPGVLERIAILFVPAFNVDGHERFGRWNRPNQNGPEETGWRTTAQNLNLNRDYTKADAPEMRAMLGLIRTWDPLVCADLHVTDGADFQPDISLQAEPLNQGDARLYPLGRELRDALIARLAAPRTAVSGASTPCRRTPQPLAWAARRWCSTTARVGVRRAAAGGRTPGAPAARSSSTSRAMPTPASPPPSPGSR